MLKPRIKIRIYKFTLDSIRVLWLYYILRYGRIVIVFILRSRGLKFGTLLDDFVEFQQFEAFMVIFDGIDVNCSDFEVNTIHRRR